MTTITLSFDNGPDPDVTPLVLETLRRHDIKASFFVLGDKLRDRRGLAEQAHAEGHWIGNHTFNHIVPLGMSAETGVAIDEIERTQALVADLAHPRKLFRPFGHGGILDARLLNREALTRLTEGGYSCVLWNVIPQDWAYPEGWVDRALSQCLSQEHALVVLHDLPTGAMKNLDRFIRLASGRGATFKQDFPAACVPIDCGRIAQPIEAYVAEVA